MAEENQQSPKTSLAFRAKKGFAGNAASGKIAKSAMPKEARNLLKSLRKLTDKMGENKNGELVEKNMLKLVLKAKVLSDEKLISLKDFYAADEPLRIAFDKLYQLFLYYGDPQLNRMRSQFEEVASLLKTVEEQSVKILKPHLQPKTIQKLTFIFDFFGNADFLMKIYSHPNLYDELFDLTNAFNKYTQFHYG